MIPGNMLSLVTEMVDPNTSGWTTKQNCSISLGTGGRNGTGCLAVKSTSSGEMQARTVSSYTVTAGTVYQVFADASGATVAERIGIRWLTSSNVEVSITWSLTTAAASATWHRIGVAAAAPMGATRAQVVVSSSPLAGAVTSFFENFYLGLPIRTTGNLMPFGVESVEVDATRWTVEANGALTRQAPMVSWAVDNYLAGGEVLALTAAAGGNSVARTVDRPTVTPGTEYRAYCYLNPPTSGSDTWIELRYYNAAGTQVQVTRGSLAAPGTGWYRQQVSDFAPSTAATCGIAVGITSATTGQVLRIEQVVVTVVPEVRAGSVLPYADASFEQGVAGWTKTTGVATIARSTPWGTYGIDGSYALTVTSTTATASVIRSAKFALPAGSGGLTWRVQITEQVTAGGWTMTRGIRWYDASNVDLGLTASTSASAPTPGWWSLFFEGTAPPTATQAAVELTLTATATNSVMRLDAIALWQTLSITSVVVVPDTASTVVTMRELVPDFLLRVYRVTADGTQTLVRGPSGLLDGTFVITSDELVIEDYEAPLATEFWYSIEVIDPDDSSVETRTSGTYLIPHDDINMAWLKDPGNPQRGLQVMVAKAPDWQRPIEQAVMRVAGRRNAVVLSDVRSGREGELQVWTRTDDELAALNRLLDPGSVLLWQAAPGMGVTDMYVAVGQITEARTGGTAMDPWRAWSLPLTVTDMPTATGINGSAGRTWQDVLSENTTWGDLPGKYLTWEHVFLDHQTG
jgi:hypothetical protein